MRASLILLGSLALACSRGDREDPSRDLLHVLADSGDTAKAGDSLTPGRQDEFDRCTYVYDTDEGLRECLVLRQGWTPEDAARAIAYRDAARGRATDSFIAAAKVELARRRQAKAAAARAEVRHRDSVYRATHREWFDGPVVELAPDAAPWMLDTRTMAYYVSGCRAARRIPVAARRFFGYESDLPAKAWPSEQEGCAAGGN